MRSILVHFDNGDTIATRINGDIQTDSAAGNAYRIKKDGTFIDESRKKFFHAQW